MASALGGEANPIALDDEELKVKYNEEIENLRNRQIIEQALMTNNPLELCFAVVRTCIPGDTFTKNRELNRAIQRYYR
jgi:predicted pyridoxine 5'-phosphate oxidase superfamily flavin-nucleotide-binding protein